MRHFLGSLCLLFVTANIGIAQTPFQNLDFETFVPSPNATNELFGDLPGWGPIAAFTHAGLNSHRFLSSNLALGNPLIGENSVTMGAGFETVFGTGELVDPLTPQRAHISQTGIVPVNSRSIRLLASSGPVQPLFSNGIRTGEFDTSWSLTLGGNEVALISTSFGEWAGDFSPSLAGTSQTLTIEMNPDFGVEPLDVLNQGFVSFDNISFSSESVVGVPEPSSTLVLVAGLLGLPGLRRRRPSHN